MSDLEIMNSFQTVNIKSKNKITISIGYLGRISDKEFNKSS